LEPVAQVADGPLSLDGFDGLMLLGGSDVNPSRYGEKAAPETAGIDDGRDAAEMDLIDQALARALPVLAICRGLQILNVYHGGTLIQHLGSELHKPDFEDRANAAHEVAIQPDTLLARIAGTSRWEVNSRHHQAAGNAGAKLRISARAEDGTIEALERPDKPFVLAVQWHPEDQFMKDREQFKLFTSFAEALG
ncbi:MAG: gamma-glutamyl-gamma-aminobutyrate hydrolase family protein, partial [Bryobacteraceae bacterium]